VKFRVFPHCNEIADVLIASVEDQLRGIKVRPAFTQKGYSTLLMDQQWFPEKDRLHFCYHSEYVQFDSHSTIIK
jgi:hypothetical protein